MIKQNWNIDNSEKMRILNLHESATKKHYLKEQSEKQKSWRLCSYTIYEEGGKFYSTNYEGDTFEIPKLSEVEGTIQDNDVTFDGTTYNGIELGIEMKQSITCKNVTSQGQYGSQSWIVYFDDIETQKPVLSAFGWNGEMQTGQSDFTGMKIPKDKDGIVIKYKKQRTRSFMLEVAPVMEGTPIEEREQPTPEPTPEYEDIEFNVDSPFNFDQTTLTPDAEKRFLEFIENIKQNYQGVKGNVDVITSASIDADPATREKYNMDLSTRRANTIIDRLKSALGETSLTFTAKPIGQTDQFAPNVKWPLVKDVNQTAPNRKLIIRLPKITKLKQ